MNAAHAGAAAIVVVNSDSTHFAMTSEDLAAEGRVHVPVVMVGKADGDVIAKAVREMTRANAVADTTRRVKLRLGAVCTKDDESGSATLSAETVDARGNLVSEHSWNGVPVRAQATTAYMEYSHRSAVGGSLTVSSSGSSLSLRVLGDRPALASPRLSSHLCSLHSCSEDGSVLVASAVDLAQQLPAPCLVDTPSLMRCVGSALALVVLVSPPQACRSSECSEATLLLAGLDSQRDRCMLAIRSAYLVNSFRRRDMRVVRVPPLQVHTSTVS